jgi:hypothetical protein
MALQLEDMFPGVRVGCRKVQRQALIQGAAVAVEKTRQARLPRRRQSAENLGG